MSWIFLPVDASKTYTFKHTEHTILSDNENILFLGSADSPLIRWLQTQSEHVIQTDDILTPELFQNNNFSFLISYGYRHILKNDVLEKFPNRAINLHISYLPWNRGADPNLWSFVENTPKGVTIHYLDIGLDTGDIIIQKEITFDSPNETLATSYTTLHKAIQELFKLNWKNIKNGICKRKKQPKTGTTHKINDKENLSHILTNGWDTPTSTLKEHLKNAN